MIIKGGQGTMLPCYNEGDDDDDGMGERGKGGKMGFPTVGPRNGWSCLSKERGLRGGGVSIAPFPLGGQLGRPRPRLP